MYKVVRNFYLLTILLSIATLCIPEGTYFLKFFMPFFGIGLILSDKNLIDRINITVQKLIFAFIGIMILYVLFWNATYYVYITPPPFILSVEMEKWIAYFMRIVFGVAITLYLMTLFKKIKGNGLIIKFVIRCSYNSLYLYIIHFVLLTSIGDKVVLNLESEILADISALAGALFLTIIMNIFICLMKRSKYTKTLILADFKD